MPACVKGSRTGSHCKDLVSMDELLQECGMESFDDYTLKGCPAVSMGELLQECSDERAPYLGELFRECGEDAWPSLYDDEEEGCPFDAQESAPPAHLWCNFGDHEVSGACETPLAKCAVSLPKQAGLPTSATPSKSLPALLGGGSVGKKVQPRMQQRMEARVRTGWKACSFAKRFLGT